MCLFLFQYYAVLIAVVLWYSLKSGSMIPPALFFLLKVALATWGLLWLHINFRIICSSSVKNVIFNRGCNQSVDPLGRILTILILPIQEQRIP